MQSVSSRIWTRVAEFISYDDSDYTTGTSTAVRITIEFMLNPNDVSSKWNVNHLVQDLN